MLGPGRVKNTNPYKVPKPPPHQLDKDPKRKCWESNSLPWGGSQPSQGGDRMSQEVSKWLVNGLVITYL